jgi:type II secretory pathway predicted ATPase ExeA
MSPGRLLGMRITGEVGAGRTVAVYAALSTLDTGGHTVIYLANVAIQAADDTALAFSHELVFVCECGCCGPRRDVDFAEDVAEVPPDGLLAEHKLRRNLGVGSSGGDQS